jgi:predicted glutamine amidotransferase
MIGYIGRSEVDVQNLNIAFTTGSKCDPYLQPAGFNCASHSHGHGYVIFDSDTGLHHYRSGRPVYEDEAPLPGIKGEVHAIFHSRLASDPKLSGHLFSHPFVAATERELIFFAHNGGVESDTLPERMVDSEWALQQIVASGSIEGALPLLKRRTRKNSALNLLLMVVPRAEGAKPAIYYLNHHATDNPARQDYYRMFSCELPGGRAVFSSTFKDLKIPGVRNVAEVPFSKLQTL